MPVSNPWHAPVVLHLVLAVHPTSILDVGIGLGTYGFLLRQYLDITRGNLDRNRWEVRIDGIEVFGGYKNPVWDYAYDSVLLGDVRSLLANIGRYDVILCNDILEHFEKQ